MAIWNRLLGAKQITGNLAAALSADRRGCSRRSWPDVDRVAVAFREMAGQLKGVVMSRETSTTGCSQKRVVKHQQGGRLTFPTRARQEATKLGLKILRGEPVPQGPIIPPSTSLPRRQSAG